jgi:hypothetical protein
MRARLDAEVEPPEPEGEPSQAETEGPAATAEVEPAAEPEATPEPEARAEPEEKSEAQTIQIDIPKEHPVSSMGVPALKADTPQEERVIRALINGTYVRRQELKTAQDENQTLTGQLAAEREKRVMYEAAKAVEEKWRGTPEYAAAAERYDQIKDQVSQEAADDYWKGVLNNLSQMTDAEYKERMTVIHSEDQERESQKFIREAHNRAMGLAPHITNLPEFNKWFENAIRSFDSEMELGHFPQVTNRAEMHDAFMRFFQNRLVGEPAVQAAVREAKATKTTEPSAADEAAKAAAEREREEAIAKKAVEDYKKGVADNRREKPPHPLGNLASASRDRVSQGSEAGETPEPQNVHQLRKAAKQRARERARHHLGGP